MLSDGPVTLDADDLQVRLQAKEGWAAAQGRSSVVVLSTELADGLIAEGLAREVIHGVQNQRKEMGCEYTDRIRVVAITPSTELHAALATFKNYVEQETLTIDLNCILLPDSVTSDQELVQSLASLREATSGATRAEMKVAGHPLVLYVKVAAGG
jgi:isoleucyl-tRNA synthetase